MPKTYLANGYGRVWVLFKMMSQLLRRRFFERLSDVRSGREISKSFTEGLEWGPNSCCAPHRVRRAAPTMDRSRAVFERWDLNGDGVLDFTEVVAGCLGTGMEPEEVSAMFEQMDVNGDGEISLDEWLSGAAVYKANAYAAVVPTPGSSRLTTGVTLAFFKDLPSIFLKLKGGGVKKLPNVLEQVRKGETV